MNLRLAHPELLDFSGHSDRECIDDGYARMCVATNGGAATVVEDIAPYSLSNWHYLAGAYNGTTNARVTMDGSNYYDTNIPPGLVINDTSSPAYRTYLFAKFNGSSQCFVGYLDEVRISTVCRSTNWLWAAWRTAMSNSQFQTYGAATLQGIRVKLTVTSFSDATMTSVL